MDILDIFLDILLKPPQPLMGLFFLLTSFRLMANQLIFDIGWVVDKACVYTMKGQW